MSQFFKVTNHEKYQHYKDRCPPWVKLHASVLEDYDFGCLPDASKAHAMLIWVLASRHNNRLPFDPRWVAQQIQATEPVDLDALVSAGFIEMYQDASAALAPLVQRTEYRGQKKTSEPKGSGEADRKTDLGTLMGAIRKVGYRKATTRRDEMRDYSVAKSMLASHPVETCLDAIEGTRRLVGESEHFTLRLVWAEGKDGGPPMFTRALDAVAKPASWEKRERTGPSDVGSILKTMGAAS